MEFSNSVIKKRKLGIVIDFIFSIDFNIYILLHLLLFKIVSNLCDRNKFYVSNFYNLYFNLKSNLDSKQNIPNFL